MASTVRYLVACGSVDESEGVRVLHQVLDTVFLPAAELPCDVQLACVVGLKIDPSAWNKTLGLITWTKGEDGKKLELTYVDDAVTIPEEEGYLSAEFAVVVPIAASGEYGFELVDCDGVFENTEDAVGTFVFGVRAVEE